MKKVTFFTAITFAIMLLLLGCSTAGVDTEISQEFADNITQESEKISTNNSEFIKKSSSMQSLHDLAGVELNQKNYGIQSEFYQEIYNIVVPYMTTNAYFNLNYPNIKNEYHQCLLMFIAYGIENNYLEASFHMDDYLDLKTGVYTIPKDQFDQAMNQYLHNPTLDDNYLVENGYMLQDKSAYTVMLDGFGLAGLLYIGDLQQLDNGMIKLRVDVSFSEKQVIDLSINFILDDSNKSLKIVEVQEIQ